ncbi:XRE family transcriptional regulator [Gaoshiqia sediminis]|uniref:LexA family transcriptional regulator n=1 Tax=Gaoshiqia sediminis TaxID=2986998 RepID=A0AA42CAC0_9BACT|nr:LexA family transcriptional regulator [Gaoshiqia sediminis]MCW0483557.1 LexA family transcriptional regulator [Gaoshiqia sediminis]
MDQLAENIKYLRKQHRLTQQELADKLQLKRSLIGSYEEGRAMPKISVLQQLAAAYNLTIDELVSINLSSGFHERSRAKGLQILPVVVDHNNDELIPIVPVKASAGYLNGFADPEFIGQLPRFSMPVPELLGGKTYRVFQIKGDSMLPVLSGSYLFCEFVESVSDLRDGQTYVLITRDEGLVYKRIYLENGTHLLLKSDNPEYEPYLVDSSSVLEIWKARGVLSFEMPKPSHLDIARLSDVLAEMKEEIRKLRDS